MAQQLKLKVLQVDVTTATTRQRVVTDKGSDDRWVASAYFKAATANTGNIFIGDSGVSSTDYMESLAAGESVSIGPDWAAQPGAVTPSVLDLYNTWVDTDNSGDDVHVTIMVPVDRSTDD